MSNKNSGKDEKPKEEKDKPEHQFSLLEEDDEFEEFPAETWASDQEDKEDLNAWEDNWDDDNVDDDFTQQLRETLESKGYKIEPMQT